jgi:methylmalonyl-CoA/ethylmalonyl-CoA epimerase
MFNKIDHVGIAVSNLKEGIELYKKLGLEFVGTEVVEDQKVETAFFKVGESYLELLAATDPTSPIARFIEKNNGRGGTQHIALNVDDVDAEIKRLTDDGFQMIDKVSRKGAHGAQIAFLHPKGTLGVLLEVCSKSTDAKH